MKPTIEDLELSYMLKAPAVIFSRNIKKNI